MTDIRQGVSDATHRVLDVLDEFRPLYQAQPLPRLRQEVRDVMGSPLRWDKPEDLARAAAIIIALLELTEDAE